LKLLYFDILFGLTAKINTHYIEDEKSDNNSSLHYSYYYTRVAIQYKNKTNDNNVAVNTFV